MKILVLSDSHSALSFMRRCIRTVKPDVVIHLGDHYDDGQVMAEENPHIRFHQVPGNCDRYRCPPGAVEVCSYPIGGVWVHMTHGHRNGVTMGIGSLLADARKMGAQVVLYGHTHRAECHQEPDGLWVMNPGSCGSMGGSAGVIKIQNSEIKACYFITQDDLEEML